MDQLRKNLRISLTFAWTNFRLRNEGSYLGVAWYLLGPLALFFIILSIQHSAFSGSTIPYYPIYLLIGITGFNFFRQSIAFSIRVIGANAEFVKSINNISIGTFVVSAVLEAFFSHLFEIVLVAAFMVYFGVPLVGILLYPLALLVFLPFVIGASFFCAALGAQVSDLDNLWIILSQLFLFATPIFYVTAPGSFIHSLNLFNPLAYFLNVAREFVIFRQFAPVSTFAGLLGLGAIACLIGIGFFEKKKHSFAEKI
jgi:ABC-type polysaccharide/polyol phosphate export permease